jgi:riboflavin biosynthesis pyrimidine reductase
VHGTILTDKLCLIFWQLCTPAHIAQCFCGFGKLILVEGGPRLLGDFYAAHVLDEQFLILAPQIAGRDVGDQRLSLVMRRTFAPGSPLWGTLIDLRRDSSHLFLRYSFA